MTSYLDTCVWQPRSIEDTIPRGHWNRFSEPPPPCWRLGIRNPRENVQFPAKNQFGEAADVAEISLDNVGVNGPMEVVIAGLNYGDTEAEEDKEQHREIRPHSLQFWL